MDIRFSLNEYYGGLHCGQTLDVKRGSKWIPTRLEMAKDWFLVGVKTNSIIGLMVRIYHSYTSEESCWFFFLGRR